MAGMPMLFLTQTPQWRVPDGDFPNPHPFLDHHPHSSSHGHAKEVQPDPLLNRRKASASIKLQPEGQRHPQLPPPRSQRTAQRGETPPGVIEPGSFIYTVKVTSNFLRLSCSSAIKSWRGTSGQPPHHWGEDTSTSSPDAHIPLCLCNCQRDCLATTGHSFRRLYSFLPSSLWVFFGHPLLFHSFLERQTHRRLKHCYGPTTSYVSLVSLFSQELSNNALETQLYQPNRLCYNVELLQSILQLLLFCCFAFISM